MATDTHKRRRASELQADGNKGVLATELISQLARRASAEFAGQLAPLGLTPAQFAVVDFLVKNGDSATQAEIARSVGVEQPTMAATLRRMERDNLIVRVPDPSDGRQSFVSPTTAVKRKRSRLAAAHERAEVNVLSSLNRSEQAELKRLLNKLQSVAEDRPKLRSAG